MEWGGVGNDVRFGKFAHLVGEPAVVAEQIYCFLSFPSLNSLPPLSQSASKLEGRLADNVRDIVRLEVVRLNPPQM